MKPRDVWIGCAAVLTVYVYGNCREAVGAKRAVQNQRDIRDNITISRMAAESFQRESTFRHERDSTSRVIAKLRSRIPRAQPDTAGRVAESLSNDVQSASGCAGAPVVCDSLIVALDERHAQDSLQAVFWKAQAAAYRDTVVPALTQARDHWKRAAGPGYMITDVAGGAAIGYGLADKNEAFVVGGIAAVALPRVFHEVGKVLGKLF